jgi:hypothetical protein
MTNYQNRLNDLRKEYINNLKEEGDISSNEEWLINKLFDFLIEGANNDSSR